MSRTRYMCCDCKRCRKYVKYKDYQRIEIHDNRCFSLRWLTILILIILQFGKKEVYLVEEKEKCCKPQQIDNSILFIIALYFLSCWIPD